MLSLSIIFVALILIDVCAALQQKSGGGRSTFIGLKYITYWIYVKHIKLGASINDVDSCYYNRLPY